MLSIAFLVVAFGCAAASWAALRALLPWLARQALAHPNARSGHVAPTPQGAGLAVIPVALVGAALALIFVADSAPSLLHLSAIAVASLLLLAIGFFDDRGALPVSARLVVQFVAATMVVLTLPAALRLSPLPLALERTLLVLAFVWAVNLTNFMDGMDWLAGSEAIAICIGVLGLALIGAAPPWLGGAAAALLGAVLGFMPANAPVARVFLGDAGSLPLGLLLGTALVHLAAAGQPLPAVILPAYFVADATLTLAWRLFRRERLWVAHRDHFYQRALAAGRPVQTILAAVASTNAVLILLALASAALERNVWSLVALGTAVALIIILFAFLRANRQRG